ncbi:MAG: hypothetical protein JWO67_6941 [Streptosporangiaceae bacterium]|nr:hypothetical protein [Streptosporangiaceae bacterium]
MERRNLIPQVNSAIASVVDMSKVSWLLVAASAVLSVAALVVLIAAGAVTAEGLKAVAALLGAVAWPLLLGAVLWGFRGSVTALLARTKTWKGPGGLEWEGYREVAEKQATLQDELTQNGVLLAGTSPVSSTGDGEGGQEEPPEDLTKPRKRAIEELVQGAAEWGAARGRLGLDVNGTAIDWGDDGLPRLVTPVRPKADQFASEDEIVGAARLRNARRRVAALQAQFEHADAVDSARAQYIYGELMRATEHVDDLERRHAQD